MGIPIPVADTPIRISQAVSKPYLITALDTNTGPIYLGLDSSVGPINYSFPLQPGSSLQWQDFSTDVYAVMDSGKTGQCVVAYEASGVALPGPTHVTATIDGPVEVDGNMFITNSVVNVGGSVANTLTLDTLINQGVPIVANPHQSVYSGAVANYETVQITLSSVPALVATTSLYQITVRWLLGAQIVATDTFAMSYTGICKVSLDVKAPNMQIVVDGVGAVNNNNFFVQVLGLQQKLPETYQHTYGGLGYLNTGFTTLKSGVPPVNNYFQFGGTMPTVGSLCVFRFSHVAGEALITNLNTSADVQVGIYAGGGADAIPQILQSSTGPGANPPSNPLLRVLLPWSPLAIEATPLTANTYLQLVMEYPQ